MLYQKNVKFQEQVIKSQEEIIKKQKKEIYKLVDYIVDRNEFCRINHRRKASVKKTSEVFKEVD